MIKAGADPKCTADYTQKEPETKGGKIRRPHDKVDRDISGVQKAPIKDQIGPIASQTRSKACQEQSG